MPGETGLKLVRLLYEQGFDPAFTSTAKVDYAMGIPLTHLNHSDAVLPVYVNAYLPPQPPIARCYAFGQAIARAVAMLGLRAVVLASGGMSHFPGTNRYANPELAWDKALLERIAAGNLKALAGIGESELDNKGNIELRCWACAAGALGERKPDIVQLDPSWHHNYASVAFFSPPAEEAPAHYPSIAPELVELTAALHALAHEQSARESWIADARSFAARYNLTDSQRRALTEMDVPAMVEMGTHPLIPFLANMQLQRLRPN